MNSVKFRGHHSTCENCYDKNNTHNTFTNLIALIAMGTCSVSVYLKELRVELVNFPV